MGVAANGGSYKTTHHPYKLNFQFGTKCLPLCGALVSGSDFKFVPISDKVGGSYDCDYLVDVIGMLTENMNAMAVLPNSMSLPSSFRREAFHMHIYYCG